MLYEKKYLFALCLWFWHRTSKSLGISYVLRAIKVSCYVNDVAFGKRLQMGLVAGRKSRYFKGAPASGEGRAGG